MEGISREWKQRIWNGREGTEIKEKGMKGNERKKERKVIEGKMNGREGKMNGREGKMKGREGKMNGREGKMNGREGKSYGREGKNNGREMNESEVKERKRIKEKDKK